MSKHGPVETLRAMSHPVRWSILEALRNQPGQLSFVGMRERSGLDSGGLNHHIKVLLAAGLIRKAESSLGYQNRPYELTELGGRLVEHLKAALEEPSGLEPAVQVPVPAS